MEKYTQLAIGKLLSCLKVASRGNIRPNLLCCYMISSEKDKGC